MPIDYSKSKIYRIVCNETGEQYFGSTTQSLAKRMATHRHHRNKSASSQIIARGNYDIVLCEEFPCENKEQLHSRERKWIEENECMNKQIPGGTKEERLNYLKKWRDENREKHNEWAKKWRDENREKICEINRNYRNKQKLKSLVTTNATEETGLQD
jgi:predicted GIY-YIG superfamily endonuclease